VSRIEAQLAYEERCKRRLKPDRTSTTAADVGATSESATFKKPSPGDNMDNVLTATVAARLPAPVQGRPGKLSGF
jgi:hypothetical protein